MLTVTDSVLLVIDVQEKLFRVMYQKEQLADNLQRLIKGIQVLEVPVLVTEQYPQGLGPTIPEISQLLASTRFPAAAPKAGVNCGHRKPRLRLSDRRRPHCGRLRSLRRERCCFFPHGKEQRHRDSDDAAVRGQINRYRSGFIRTIESSQRRNVQSH